MNETNEEILGKQAQYFANNGVAVHIQKKNGKWVNGHILEVLADFIMLNERLMGQIPVFFGEIESIEAYKRPEVKR